MSGDGAPFALGEFAGGEEPDDDFATVPKVRFFDGAAGDVSAGLVGTGGLAGDVFDREGKGGGEVVDEASIGGEHGAAGAEDLAVAVADDEDG